MSDTETADSDDLPTPEAEGQTPETYATASKLAIDGDWSTEDWDGPEYNQVPIPNTDELPRWEWDAHQRRAYILSLLHEYGPWRAVPMTQEELGEEFGVPQQRISEDLQEIREYIRFHAGNTAVSMTDLVANKAVAGLLEEGDFEAALDARLKYNEFLFDLGRLEKEPERVEQRSVSVSADAADLTDEEAEDFEKLSEMLNDTRGSSGNEIRVESTQEES